MQTKHYATLMAVMARESWSDERLDDLKGRMDERFDDVDRRFDDVDRRFAEVDKRFDQVDKRFDRVEADIRELRGIMIGGFVALLVALIGTSAL
jgi:tetrahydromethanopterin S-methyltransferase subunit G